MSDQMVLERDEEASGPVTVPTRRRVGRLRVLAVVALAGLVAGVYSTASESGDAAASTVRDVLLPGRTLAPGQELRSSNGYHFVMQGDGNAVIYQPLAGGGRRAIWASNTAGRTGSYLTMQGDGNLVMYQPSGSGRVIVYANSSNGVRLPSDRIGAGTYLVMQTDGNLVAYRPLSTGGRVAVWASNTPADLRNTTPAARSAVGCPAGAHYDLCARSVREARSDTAANAIKFALSQVGRPYCRPQNPFRGDGNQFGRGPQRCFDCSGLMFRAYEEAGINIGGRNSTQQLAPGGVRRAVHPSAARPGDIVGKPGSHVVMKLAGGMIVESPRPGLTVRVTRERTFPNAVFIVAR